MCSTVFFLYRNPGLGRYLEGKGIPPFTTRREWKGEIPHFFHVDTIIENCFLHFPITLLFPPVVDR